MICSGHARSRKILAGIVVCLLWVPALLFSLPEAGSGQATISEIRLPSASTTIVAPVKLSESVSVERAQKRSALAFHLADTIDVRAFFDVASDGRRKRILSPCKPLRPMWFTPLGLRAPPSI